MNTLRLLLIVFVAASVCLTARSAGIRGAIEWRCRPIDEKGSVENGGRTVCAFAGTECEVAGVCFSAMESGGKIGGRIACERAVVKLPTGLLANGNTKHLSPEARMLLGGGVGLTCRKRCPHTLRIGNLVVGRRYLIQLWFSDMREDPSAHFISVDGAACVEYNAPTASFGTTAIGEFVADSESRMIRLVPDGTEFLLNAIQVRALDESMAGDGKAKDSRASWMAGRYGLMVHWLFARYTSDRASVDGLVDAFDLNAFMEDFDQTGADWLIFTIGQNTGAYASPNSVIERLCGPGHCSRRDLIEEIAVAVHSRGKRFIAYLPVDCLVPSIQQGMCWTKEDLTRRTFQVNWANVIREWAERFGTNLDGWWFDGAGYGHFPLGFNEGLWTEAARAGNPDCALAYSTSLTAWRRDPDGREFLGGVRPATSGDDYLGGEFNLFKDARIWTGLFGVKPESTWMPEAAEVPGTRCQVHALFCLDGFWPCWAPWPKAWERVAPFARRLPGHFSTEAMNAMRERGEFPDPILEVGEFLHFMEEYRRAGGGVTVNVGITPTGRLNPKSLEYMRRLTGNPPLGGR